MFHGSYKPDDVTFLLKAVDIATTGVAEKERAIQSGEQHYSEMLSDEKDPTPEYMQLFDRAVALNGDKLAAHIASLARTIAGRGSRSPVVVSLARAGTPIGVLLHRGLKHMGLDSTHYCVSIIRDRGVDWAALDYIIARHRDTDIVFVDGWTGKGVISKELAGSVRAFNSERATNIDGTLAVVADLAGAASMAVTSEDYLIPNAVLNSTVSGLVSRTVLNTKYVGPGDFHACAFYAHKALRRRSDAGVAAGNRRPRALAGVQLGQRPEAGSASHLRRVRHRGDAPLRGGASQLREARHRRVDPHAAPARARPAPARGSVRGRRSASGCPRAQQGRSRRSRRGHAVPGCRNHQVVGRLTEEK
jgi:hypothetical protein